MIQLIVQATIFLIRFLLAAVLITSGAAKLTDTRGFTLTLIGLGLPTRRNYLIRSLSLLFPLLELGLGLVIVSGRWPEVVDILLLALLTFFSAVVIRAVITTPNVTCRCFGALSNSQFSGRGLVRSLLLTFLAAVVEWNDIVNQPRFDGPPIAIILLILGYLIFAAAAAEAAKTLALIKERSAS